VVLHVSNPAVLIFDSAGKVVDAWGDRFPGAHGLTLVEENGVEYLWLTDFKTGEVTKATLSGETVLSLPAPDYPGFNDPKYAPTWVAVFEERYGGNGDIWVADGYGAANLHRYDKTGRYLSTIDGTKGAGRFRHPHGIYIDPRKREPELYVADRMNRRVQVFDPNGQFRRVLGDTADTSPCGFAPYGDFTLIPEAPYRARLSIIDPRDRLVATIAANDEICARAGFPNERSLFTPGRFVTPHSAAADSAGNIYVVEWVTGGRITKLASVR
jgi:sugar lactone lactonase YvrE